MFQKTLDLGVARYMGKVGLIGSFLGQFHDKKDTESGHITRDFDWDGSTVWTTCDCELAANEWLANSKELKVRYNGSQESYATMFVNKCGRGVIFGNGAHLYYKDSYGQFQQIDNSTTPYSIRSIEVCHNGNTILSLKDERGATNTLVILHRENDNEKYRTLYLSIDKSRLTNQIKGLESLKYFEKINGTSYIALYNKGNFYDNPNVINDLILVNHKTKKFAGCIQLHSIQDISLHPVEEKIAVIGNDLTILTFPKLEVLSSTPLNVPRNSNSIEKVIAYSPCGKHLAISYNMSGDIEIIDPNNMSVKHIFNGYGIPQTDISWDITGRFLGCRFKTRERGNYKLIVWNMLTLSKTLEVDSSNVEFGNGAFKWDSYSTKLCCLVNNQRIQVFELVS